MKKNLFFIILLFSITAGAQRATLKGDAVTYLGKQYKVGDIIHLGYGSGNNKEFAFINYGKSVGGFNLPGLYHHADVNWSKADVEILKLYKTSGVIWAKCKPLDMGSSIGSILGNKVFINIEGAVDNKEIKGVDQQSNNLSTSQLNNAPPPSQTTKIQTPIQMKKAPVPPPAKSQKAIRK